MIRITRSLENKGELYEYALHHNELLQAVLAQYLPINFSSLFARPVKSSDGAVEWYSDLQGQPRPFAQLSGTEREKIRAQITRQLAAITRLHGQLSEKEAVNTDVLALLAKISHFPAEEQIWSIDNQPVILWGQAIPPASQPLAQQLIAQQSLAKQSLAAGNTNSPDPALPAQRRKFRWMWWLLLLLLALLLLWLLRGCLSPTFSPVKPVNLPEEIRQPVAETAVVEPVDEAIGNAVLEESVVEPEVEPEKVAPKMPPNVAVKSPPVDVKKLCPAQRSQNQAPEVVLVFDASESMFLGIDVTPRELQRWLQGLSFENVEREPRRITVAKQSAKKIIDKLPSDMSISLVAASDCQRVLTSSSFTFGQRRALKRTIDRIEPEGKTPLALALEKAGALVDGVDRDAMILLISDGDETCGGDPCAVANALKRKKPRLQVNVVDIMNTGAGNCIAEQTGGKVFAANNASQFTQVINQAIQEYIPENCN
ncbi:virulence effector protein [Xenorhabdus beddingii]|uniref:Virulence effector protein n=1 Tax=Xenorhabdus beddingii TaxID=40578 RepID=A0A1Y2SRK6_9GAMM|nr:VWA domain-containing protein [Xenorhabdus beddingii]OTA20375.1 virulence effector protein [Xenorhabdus beddingii]